MKHSYATIISNGEPLRIKVFEPGRIIEHNGRLNEVVSMNRSHKGELTGEVTVRRGNSVGVVWSNYCNCQPIH
jgi:hypothetical protein